jgi:hypothetical protein
MWIKGVVEGLIGEIEVPIIFADNEAVIKFVKGEVEIKSAKHMEIKMYHAMEEYEKKTFVLEFMSGDSLPADLLTKVSSRERFSRFVNEVQGEEDHGYSLDSEDDDDGKVGAPGGVIQETDLQVGASCSKCVDQVEGCVGG